MTWEPTCATVHVGIWESAFETNNQLDYFDLSCIFWDEDGAGQIPQELMAELRGSYRYEMLFVESMDRVSVALGSRVLEATSVVATERMVVVE